MKEQFRKVVQYVVIHRPTKLFFKYILTKSRLKCFDPSLGHHQTYIIIFGVIIAVV
jgi:hypothetical protein